MNSAEPGGSDPAARSSGRGDLVILDPSAEPGLPVTPYEAKLTRRLEGARIALLSNGFPDASVLLTELGKVLERRFGAVVSLFERYDPTVSADGSVVSTIAQDYDAAVTAMGHCGSCTSSTVRDAIALGGEGIPVTALVSEKFWPEAIYVSRAAGMPDVPRVRLPHPVTGTGLANIAAVAEDIADLVVSALIGRG